MHTTAVVTYTRTQYAKIEAGRPAESSDPPHYLGFRTARSRVESRGDRNKKAPYAQERIAGRRINGELSCILGGERRRPDVLEWLVGRGRSKHRDPDRRVVMDLKHGRHKSRPLVVTGGDYDGRIG